MYESAEQQLALVSHKTQHLRQLLQQQIDTVKRLRLERTAAVNERDKLRQQLQQAETRAAVAECTHSEAERCLRRTAEEFAGTQLLQKRYCNTLAELDRRQRSLVRVVGAATQQDNTMAEETDKQQACGAAITVTDECTVVELGRRRTFVVDVACTAPSLRQRLGMRSGPSAHSLSSSSCAATTTSTTTTTSTDNAFQPASLTDEELFSAIRMDQVIEDTLSGVNTVFLSFGPAGGGKTEVLFGTKAAILEYETLRQLSRNVCSSSSREGSVPPTLSTAAGLRSRHTAGVLSLFTHGLFSSLVSQGVTHFNIRCSFAEFAMNQTIDLLMKHTRRYSSTAGFGLEAGGGIHSGRSVAMLKAISAVGSESTITPIACGGMSEEVASVKVETAEEVMQLFFSGMERLGRWRYATTAATTSHCPQSTNGVSSPGVSATRLGGVSHAVFTLTVESFNTKGHYRRAAVSFVDLCGPPAAAAARTAEEQWAEESIQSLCDAVAATSGVKRGSSHVANTTSNGDHYSVRSSSSSDGSAISDAQRAAAVFDRLSGSHTNCLMRFLRPIFGGNAKAVLLCCVDAAQHSKEQLLNSLSYAYFFKRIQHRVTPYDIPPELQRLNIQMNAVLSAGDDSDGEKDHCGSSSSGGIGGDS